MTPATTAGASRATRKAESTTRTSRAVKKAPPAAKASVPTGGAKKTARPAVAKAARTGRVASSPATGAASTARKAKTAPQKASATRSRVAPTTSRSGKAAPRAGQPTPRQPAGPSRSDAGTKTAKAGKKPATKETVKKSVTSTSRTTTSAPRSAKDKKPSGVAADGKATARTLRQSPAQATAGKAPSAPAKKAASRRSPAPSAGPYAQDEKFLAEQRQLLESERVVYVAQASDLKAEADSLAQEREPGDVQFDEESGEGGTVTVDRERDLALSAQALAAVEEIDAALAKIAARTYGACERCQQPIPKPRLKALPYARLCVACKSGGLSRR